MLVSHQLRHHRNNPQRLKLSKILELIKDDIAYSSDSDCDYKITTSVIRLPRPKVETDVDRKESVLIKSNLVDNQLEYNLESQINQNETNESLIKIENVFGNISDEQLADPNLLPSDHKLHSISPELSSGSVCNGKRDNEILIDSNIVTCTECSQQFFKIKNEIYKHMRIKHKRTFKEISEMFQSNENNKFLCIFCNETYDDKKTIATHLKRLHRTELALPELTKKTYKCVYCAKVFTRASVYYAHRRQHEENRDKRLKTFLCYICGKSYPGGNHLKVHMRKHTGERPYKCEVCGRDFAIKKTWQDHVTAHTGAKPYKCNYEGCGKTFAHASGVRQHTLCIHIAEKKYQCDYCNKQCSKKGHLREHIRIHTGERPHECKICGTKFKLRSTLRIHSRTHTGERPFKCSLCNKGFIKSYGLKQHMRNKRSCIPKANDSEGDYNNIDVGFK